MINVRRRLGRAALRRPAQAGGRGAPHRAARRARDGPRPGDAELAAAAPRAHSCGRRDARSRRARTASASGERGSLMQDPLQNICSVRAPFLACPRMMIEETTTELLRPADPRRGRPGDRLRHPRRVRPRAASRTAGRPRGRALSRTARSVDRMGGVREGSPRGCAPSAALGRRPASAACASSASAGRPRRGRPARSARGRPRPPARAPRGRGSRPCRSAGGSWGSGRRRRRPG